MNMDLEGFSHGQIVAASAVRVFATLSTPAGIARWWEQPVQGSAAPGGSLTFRFADPHARTTVRVEQVEADVLVLWRVTDDTGYGGEWLDTRIRFRLSPIDAHTTLLEFRHIGLTPLLRSYSDCTQGWRRYLGTLARVAESA